MDWFEDVVATWFLVAVFARRAGGDPRARASSPARSGAPGPRSAPVSCSTRSAAPSTTSSGSAVAFPSLADAFWLSLLPAQPRRHGRARARAAPARERQPLARRPDRRLRGGGRRRGLRAAADRRADDRPGLGGRGPARLPARRPAAGGLRRRAVGRGRLAPRRLVRARGRVRVHRRSATASTWPRRPPRAGCRARPATSATPSASLLLAGAAWRSPQPAGDGSPTARVALPIAFTVASFGLVLYEAFTDLDPLAIALIRLTLLAVVRAARAHAVVAVAAARRPRGARGLGPADRARQLPRVPGAPRTARSPRPPRATRRSASWCSTSITSRRSTTPSATPRATACCRPPPRRSRAPSGRRASSRASAARSSRSPLAGRGRGGRRRLAERCRAALAALPRRRPAAGLLGRRGELSRRTPTASPSSCTPPTARCTGPSAPGRDRVRCFDPEHVVALSLHEQRREVEALLATPGAIVPAFQPVMEVATGRVAGYEALARFAAPYARPPQLWFAQAHRCGLGPALEARAIERRARRAGPARRHVPLAQRVTRRAALAGGQGGAAVRPRRHRDRAHRARGVRRGRARSSSSSPSCASAARGSRSTTPAPATPGSSS